jgi:hypothetical protein
VSLHRNGVTGAKGRGRGSHAALFAVLIIAGLPRVTNASGHGPVFGAATPTLGKGGWQIDQAWLARLGQDHDTREHTLRTMVSFGVTEDVQIAASFPVTLSSSAFMVRGRLTAMMSPSNEIEGSVAWRVHSKTSAGARFESTVSVGGALPLEQYHRDGMQAATSLHVSGATGYASRTNYLWLGGGYVRHNRRGLHKIGDVAFVSAVYGYRPPALRLDYPKPDLRFFAEAVAEHTERGIHHGVPILPTGGTAVLVGPSALLLYKAYALSGGVLFPVHQRTNLGPRERFRCAVNVSYFFWRR